MKKIFIAILVLFLIMLNGCSLNCSQPDSARDNDWKILSSKDTLYKMIYDGDSRGSTALEGDTTVEYSLRVPASWTLDGTVLTDSNNNKIAEIAPVVLLSQGEEAEFLDYKAIEGKVLSKEPISVAEFKGRKVILQTSTESGTWYPHMYLLSDGMLGFTFTMYSPNQTRDKAEEKLFDRIVQTIRFKEITCENI